MAIFTWKLVFSLIFMIVVLSSDVKAQFDCSFDDGLCSWKQDQTDYDDWKFNSGPTTTPGTGPSQDHTSGNGQYLYVETSDPFAQNKNFRLISPQDQVQPGGTKCFQFYYHMYGSTTGYLNVYVAKATESLPVQEIWTRSGDQGDQWNFAQIDLTRPDSDTFDVTIEVYVKGLYYGDTAIDDVQIVNGFCSEIVITPAPSSIPSLSECDFENPDLCGYWQQNITDELNWFRNKGPTSSSNTGPSTDHTYGTGAGFYMYIESTNPNQEGDTAQLWTPPFPAEGGHCIEFFYHMWGDRMGTLNVYALAIGDDLNASIPIWTRSGDQGNDWNMARTDASALGDFQIVFEGIIGLERSDMAIDDVIVSDNTCQEQGDCNFESDMCTWMNEDDTDDFDWVRQQGDTTLGPTRDHTLGNAAGHYIFMNVGGQSQGKITRLTSAPYLMKTGTRRCITFWYYLEGVGAGSLQVTQVTAEDGDIDRWLIGSTQGSEWNYGQVAVSQDRDYWVIFQGEVGTSSTGSLAVDDIAIKDNGCPVIPYGAEVGPPLPSTQAPPSTVPPVVIPPGPVNCDFEAGLCSYTHDSAGDFEWIRRRGYTDTPDTGPDTDHTHQGAIVNAGWYMYTEGDFRSDGDAARLISGEFTPVTTSCLTFWYHMHGSEMGTLNVNTTQGGLMWTRTGTQGNKWQPFKMNIASSLTPVNVIFEGIMTGGITCDMAIDDIQLDNNACTAEDFCDFENGLAACGYLQEDVNDWFDWSVGFGETPTRLTGPYIDHTTGTMTGYYAYIEADTKPTSSHAWLKTHLYPGAGVHCVKFYYYMYGADIGDLTMFYLKTNGQSSFNLFYMTGDQGKQWNVARVPIDISDDFQLVFRASVTNGNLGDIALDDILLSREACPPLGNIDFEDGFESWTNDPSDDFDLIIGQGSTNSPSTGPSQDHTLGTSEGSYVYVESTNTFGGHIGRFRSPLLPPTAPSGRCMRFWYHMNGIHIGVLRVLLQAVDGSMNTTLWDYGANIGDVWNDGQVPINSSSSSYWMVFEITEGGGSEGDMALDDISFSEDTCGVYPPIANPDTKTTTAPTTTQQSTTPGIRYSCTFDLDWCDFTQATDDDFQWSRTNEGTPSFNTGPEQDHTQGDASGYYVFTESSLKHRQSAAFKTPPIPSNWGGACIDYWYHMYGEHIGTLNVYAELNSSHSDLMWTRSGSLDRRWYQAVVHYSTSTEFKFVFEGVMGIDDYSDMALDDIYITQGPCPALHACNFEDADICGYTQDLTDDFDWSWGSGATPTPYTGPSVDVTMETEEGHYMYIEASNQTAGEKARLISPRFIPDENSTNVCWSFFYHMYGYEMGTLNMKVEGSSDVSWTYTPDRIIQDRWYYGEFDVTSLSSYTVIMEGVVGSGERGDLAVDEVDYRLGPCSFGACTYEDGYCAWVNEEGDDADWIVMQGPADLNGRTGPNVDHTLGTDKGHYLLADSNEMSFSGATAVIHLGEPHFNGTQCLTFWYMMNGLNVGELMVLASDGSPLSVGHIVWMLAGQQQQDGDTWLDAAVTIDFVTNSDVYIMAVITSSPYGDIAIDDLNLQDGSCDFYPPEASPEYTFKPLTCDFEEDTCSWTQDQTDGFEWQRDNGHTWGTGPHQDHTTGTGFYLYTPSTNNLQKPARMISPVQDGRTEPVICFQFWYNMNGETMGSLHVNWKSEDGSNGGTLWRRAGGMGDIWQSGKVEFYPPQILFEFQIEGTIGDGIYSDMAIDDLSASLAPCPPTRKCDFTHDMCGWIQETNLDDFDWTRGTGMNYPQPGMTFPDHTWGSENGYFIYANHSAMVNQGDKALLYTNDVPATEEGDCMSFWYHQKGSSILRVWERVGDDLIGPYWESSPGSLINDWMQQTVTVKAPSTFKVVFEAEIGPSNDGEIAVDDINLEINPCVAQGFCDFETNQCLWENVYDDRDDSDWFRNQGGTDTDNTGPDIDHTTGKFIGFYMLFQPGLQAEGRVAWLVSEAQAPTQGCFEFWYHMYGDRIGALNVYVQDLVSEVRALEWNMTGDQGNQWVKGQINLDQVDAFSIIFEGVVGSGSRGDIALDDLFFLPPGQMCNESSPINCDFEDGWCEYTQDINDDFNWLKIQGASLPEDKVPGFDHTRGDSLGWYIYIDTADESTGDIARTRTPFQPITSRQCLTFFYHMDGASLETLNVYVRRSDADDSDVGSLVWTLRGGDNDEWLEAQVSVVESLSFQVVFEGVVGSAFTGDIALDDISIYHGYCPGTARCDFENPFICGYIQDTTDQIDWIYWSGSTPNPNTGPSFDVTYGTLAGHYLYIGSEGFQGSSARLYSPHIISNTPDEVHCWRYYYHMYGQDVYALELRANYGDRRQLPLASHVFDQGNQWNEGVVQLSLAEYDLLIEGVLGASGQRDIAIDALSMTRTGCDDCDFEKGFCGWSNNQDGSAQLNWRRQSGSTTTPQTGPQYDHTTLSDAGFYIYIEGSSPSRSGYIGKISSSVFLVNEAHTCFSFWYMMHGQDVGELTVYMTESGALYMPWRLRGEQNDDDSIWKQGKIEYSAGGYVKFEFWGVIGSGEMSDIALDDISLIPGTCDTYPPEAVIVPTTTPIPPTTVPPSGSQSCNFETDICDFYQAIDDDIDWSRQQGATLTLNTGPSVDHTLGTDEGFYIYTEATLNVNKIARLESRLFPATMRSCVTFWYHMWGTTMGRMSVYGKEGLSLGSALWTREGSLNDQWFEAQVQYAPSANYKIVFEGLTGSAQQSDMALDDISIAAGYCPVTEVCTFENVDICNYIQDTQDDYDWTWGSGPTPTLYTGPSYDVTYGTGSGHYVYASAVERTLGDIARLQSEEVTHAADQTDFCASFYYHMFGTQMGTLNVLLKEGDQEVSTPKWSQGQEDLSDHWYLGEVSLSSDVTFRVVFEAIQGSGVLSDIAIDDVYIAPGLCHQIGDCDFESETCAWENIDRDDLDWIVQQGSSGVSGPTVDHTLGAEGHYLFVDSNFGSAIGLQAYLVLAAPAFTGVKCLKFWYMLYGYSMGQLLVYSSQASDLSTRELVWMLEGQQSSTSTTWLQASVPFDFDDIDDVYIVAILGSTSYSDIAIDDINILTGTCDLNPAKANPESSNNLIDCDFERTFCYWNQGTNAYRWMLYTRSTATPNTGPTSAPNSESGWYTYVEAGLNPPGTKALLQSPLQHESAYFKESCLEFYYHMFGADMGYLNVYVERTDLNTSEIVWKKGGTDQGSVWHVAQVNIGIEPGDGFYRLIFEAVRGDSELSDIAIDEVTYHNGTCPPLRTCGFEVNQMCGWTQDRNDIFDWTRDTASTLRSTLGDHTYGLPTGNILYANQGTPQMLSDYAILLSPVYPATSTGDCFSFWYHIHGENDVGNLRVHESINGDLYGPYWSSSGVNEGDTWWKASVTLKSASSFQIALVADVGTDPNSELAVDDFMVMQQPCAPRGSCTFDMDYCTWTNAISGDDSDWVRVNGVAVGAGTGPTKDHTTATSLGSFLYTDAADMSDGDIAWLMSEIYPAGDVCFSFWYHMNGPGLKSLILYTEDQSNHVKDLTWNETGNYGDRWVEGLVSLSNPDAFQIILEASYNAGSLEGSIALDDIVVAEGGLCDGTSLANCNFEDGMCGYEQASDDDFDWTGQQGRTSTDNTGPSYDHTTMTSQGWYMYMEASNPQVTDMETRLMSPVITMTTRQCLQFWYHMYGREVGALNLLTRRESARPGDIGSVLWTRSGDIGDQWMSATVVVGESDSFKLVFQGIVLGAEGDIAIDDISMHSGDCRRTLSCEFEDPQICGYVQDVIGDEFDWTFWSGDTPTSNTGPSNDVTYGTSFGHYMYIEASGQHTSFDKARLYSPHVSMETTQTVCWRYYYHMFGRDAGLLYVGYRDSKMQMIPVADLSGSQGDEWIEGQVEVTANGYEMYFTGVYQFGDEGDIAIDSVSMTPGRCVDCDFESSWCGWVNSEGDDFDWVRWRGEASTPDTGPVYDHTKQTEAGYYLLFDTSEPRRLREVAHVSNVFYTDDTEKACFTFWFHMFGQDVAELSLQRVPLNTGIVEFVWGLTGSQSTDRTNWIQGQLPFQGNTLLAFTGTVGAGIYGDLALDDFLFVPGDCVVLPPEADLQPKSTPVPTTPPDLSTYSCDFEDDLCTYTQSEEDDIDWTRVKGETPTPMTGPAQDHTSGNGWYIYTEASAHYSSRARLESAIVPSAIMSSVCVSFWFHMYGDAMGTLSVRPKIGDNLMDAIWSRSGSMPQIWFHGQVDYQSKQNFKIVFDGYTGTDIFSDMALDDVTIYEGKCQGVHECTFEFKDICGYSQSTTDDFDWTWGTGSTETPYTGPSVDVSTGTPSGHYMYIDASKKSMGELARISTPELDPSDGKTDLCWTFYYHMFGDDIGALSVFIEGDDTPLWTLSGMNLGDMWFHSVVNVTSFVKYKLTFEGVVGKGPTGDIAIDDVDFSIGLCKPEGSCDFEAGMCAWQNVAEDDFDWVRRKGPTSDFGTGPNVDHTKNTDEGFYIYTESSAPQRPGDEALLLLSIPDIAGKQCLQFWYHMYGLGMGELLVYTANSSTLVTTDRYIWRLVGSQTDDQFTWLYGQVQLDFDVMSKIYFAGVIGSQKSDMALDDIIIIESPCEVQPPEAAPSTGIQPLSCDFDDNNLCSWTQDRQDDFNWILHSGPTETHQTGPDTDHSGTGYYIYIDATQHSEGDVTRLVSPTRTDSTAAVLCMQFYYHMYGSGIGRLDVRWVGAGGTGEIVFNKGGSDMGNRWIEGLVNVLPNDLEFHLVIEGFRGSSSAGDIAVDDILVTEGFCPPERICDFELGYCGWRQERSTDDFDWSRDAGIDVPHGSQPFIDHTTGTDTGHFIYADQSLGMVGDRALLYSGPFDATPIGDCMMFWYHLASDRSVGTLRVWELVDDNLIGPYWVSGDGVQPSFWMKAFVNVKANATFQVAFEATLSDTTNSWLAVDDVTFDIEPCLHPGICDFDDIDYCYWTNTQNGDSVDWQLYSGSTTTSDTGPSNDHTKGTSEGYYVYLESSSLVEGDTARLESEIFNPSDKCFTFWYHMYGKGMGSLNVYVRDQSNQQVALLWSEHGNHGDRWVEGQVSLSGQSSFNIIMEATYGGNYTGDIALDDTFIDQTRLCNETVPTTGPGRGTTSKVTETSGQETPQAPPTTPGPTEKHTTGPAGTEETRTEGPSGEPNALAITFGVLGGIFFVILIVIAAWFITKRRSSSKLEIAALHTNMENPAYDPNASGGDIILNDMEKKPVEMDSRYRTFSPIVDTNDGFENPTYATATVPDDINI